MQVALQRMKEIFAYIKDYISAVNKNYFFCSSIFLAVTVFLNYQFSLNQSIYLLPKYLQYVAWYGLFLIIIVVGYGLLSLFTNSVIWSQKKFLILLLLAPMPFAWKMVFPVHLHLVSDYDANEYWNAIIYWPFKVVVLGIVLYLLHRLFNRGESFYGLTFKNFSPRPYLILLFLMLPLLFYASTQKDFLVVYPRWQNLDYLLQANRGWHKLLYEVSYGSDFLSIELFFRGFLVLAFVRWVGKDAILPMAMFYCAIHFGKPLAECISSYFGGLILGIITYHTRTMMGGFIVHVGIAWLMEIGGMVGNVIW